MIGLRTGLATGLRTGLALGIGADEIRSGAVGGWATDATSGIAVPSSLTEWNDFISAKGLSISAPDGLYLFQEASGDFADSIGSITLAASGTISYAQAVSGWSRAGWKVTDGVLGRASSVSASLPDLSSASMTTLFLARVDAATALRDFYIGGVTTLEKTSVNATPRIRAACGANAVTGTNSPAGAVRPYVNKYDFTNSAKVTYTDQEKLTPTFAACAGKGIALGGAAGTLSPTATFVYGVRWDNAHGEISDANVKALLVAMGFAIPWT